MGSISLDKSQKAYKTDEQRYGENRYLSHPTAIQLATPNLGHLGCPFRHMDTLRRPSPNGRTTQRRQQRKYFVAYQHAWP